MATTIKIRGTSDSDEAVTLVGRAVRPLTKIVSILRSRVIREITLPIEAVSEEPDVTFTADLIAPSQLQQSQSTELSADLFSQEVEGGPLSLVEEYDPTHWDKAIVSGGASATLGGADGDTLTATTTLGAVVVEFTYNVAGSPAEGTVATATVEVVSVPVFTPELYNLPSSVIQGQSYDLRARLIDGTTGEVTEQYDPARWTFSVTGPASIAGPNLDVLSVNPGSAGGSLSVTATHVTAGPDVEPTNIVTQPVGNFPEGLEPSDMTVIKDLDGSTMNWGAGFNPSNGWEEAQTGADNTRFEVLSDPESKHGSVIEKRGFVGNPSGWMGGLNVGNNIANHRELYFRYVYKLSSNYDFHGSAVEKLWYYGRSIPPGGGNPAQSPTQFFINNRRQGRISFVNQAGGASGKFMGMDMGSAFFLSNDLPNVTVDEYHTVEVLHRMNSEGNTDGYVVVRYDGVEAESWNWQGNPNANDVDLRANVEWIKPGAWPNYALSGGEFFLFWGGQNDEKTSNDHIRLSELYISGRG